MAAPKEYFSSDSNAPVARGERRSLHDILYACLVAGYGDKEPAGWSLEWVNATFDKAVFRPNPTGGPGFFLQIDGTVAGGASNAGQNLVQGYESMTDLDTGLGPFMSAAALGITTSTTQNTTARPWYLIADDKHFKLYIWNGITATPTLTDNYVSTLEFGDGIKKDPNDSSFCILAHSSGSNYSNAIGANNIGSSTSTSGSQAIWSPRSKAGVAGSRGQMLIHGSGPGSDNSLSGANGPTYNGTDEMDITRPHINDAAAYTIRGWDPGLWYPCYSHPFTAQLGLQTIDGVDYRTLKTYANGSGSLASYMFSLADWRA